MINVLHSYELELNFIESLLTRFLFAVNNSREKLLRGIKNSPLPNGKVSEMEPLTELPSMDDLTSGASGVESWLDTSSKYHSCELLDT